MTSYLFTRKSRNKKIGPIAVVTISDESCAPSCPLLASGACYAKHGPLGGLWRNMSKTEPGQTFKNGVGTVMTKSLADVCEGIASLDDGEMWRWAQAGDLPHDEGEIDLVTLGQLTIANRGRRGFGYTHHDVLVGEHARHNQTGIRFANQQGLTINLSADDLDEADRMIDLKIGPVVVTLPHDQMTNTVTPKGVPVVICPEMTGKSPSCLDCGLCAREDRKAIVGFPGHGPKGKAV